MRVKVHPDRMNLAAKTEEEKQKIHEEASKVGQAADVLSDRRKVSLGHCTLKRFGAMMLINDKQRREYDREVEYWEMLYGGH